MNKKVIVHYNKLDREGVVVEERKDKVKVHVLNPGNHKNQTSNWFDIKDVKFVD